jgi:hypothetical protein
MRSRSKRQGRSLFLYYICAMYLAVFMAAPLVRALEPAGADKQAGARGSASAGASKAPVASSGAHTASAGGSSAIRWPAFDDCDRNRDGFLDKSEASAVPGLSAYFERVDTNKDGKLDAGEFDKALAFLESQRK